MDRCPITGMPCGHPRIIHITDVGPGNEAQKVSHLCEVCGMGQMEPDKQPEPGQKIFKNFLEVLDMIFKNPQAFKGHMLLSPTMLPQNMVPVGPAPCPGCGCTIHDIAATAKVGCATCYNHFKSELSSVLFYAHKSLEHKGKRPKNFVEQVKEQMPVPEQIALLKLKLQELIREERYEDAASVKKELDELINRSAS